MQVAAGSEVSLSQAAMERGDQQSAKKPRLANEDEGAMAMAAAAAAEHGLRREISVKMDASLLHCSLCRRPLKPPVFQCKGGHLACRVCLLEPSNKCEHDGAFDVRSWSMETVLSSIRAECDDCRRYVTYHELADHRGACPRAPCKCTVPNCLFVGPGRALLDHLTAAHSMPMHKVQYGKDLVLEVPASLEPRHLLLGEEDDRAFLMVGSGRGPGAALSLVCIRAEAMVLPVYKFNVRLDGLPLPKACIEVTSSTAPCAVAVEELTYLYVPPKLLVGSEASRRLSLKIRIDRLHMPPSPTTNGGSSGLARKIAGRSRGPLASMGTPIGGSSGLARKKIAGRSRGPLASMGTPTGGSSGLARKKIAGGSRGPLASMGTPTSAPKTPHQVVMALPAVVDTAAPCAKGEQRASAPRPRWQLKAAPVRLSPVKRAQLRVAVNNLELTATEAALETDVVIGKINACLHDR